MHLIGGNAKLRRIVPEPLRVLPGGIQALLHCRFNGHYTPVTALHNVITADNRRAVLDVRALAKACGIQVGCNLIYLLSASFTRTVARLQFLRVIGIDLHIFQVGYIQAISIYQSVMKIDLVVVAVIYRTGAALRVLLGLRRFLLRKLLLLHVGYVLLRLLAYLPHRIVAYSVQLVLRVMQRLLGIGHALVVLVYNLHLAFNVLDGRTEGIKKLRGRRAAVDLLL